MSRLCLLLVTTLILVQLSSAYYTPTARVFGFPALSALSRSAHKHSILPASSLRRHTILFAEEVNGGNPPPPSQKNNNNNNNGDDNNDDDNPISSLQKWFSSPEAAEDIKTYTLSLFVALSIRFFIVEPRYIPSLSMYPTFEVGDQLAVEKITKRIRPPRRGEVVVFNPPQAFREMVFDSVSDSSKKAKEALIKRVVATEGDVVVVKSGNLFINNEQQDESYRAEKAFYDFGPVTVPPGQLLVLGDNRNHSLDGHIWGFLPKENVIGRAVYLYWPPWRFGNDGLN
ncbi:hypothetical protein TrLO_g6826 [Triparma laevis f. longispina]|uniref:Mitochondrial inner membrane protease subunit n=2 Tax=Triparma laevis TaxID=1534972 RepID=A0A9W7KS04_9STRA|nr:hypothetical protein TrLO_g6826 [Triparma laevis f. longispina]